MKLSQHQYQVEAYVLPVLPLGNHCYSKFSSVCQHLFATLHRAKMAGYNFEWETSCTYEGIFHIRLLELLGRMAAEVGPERHLWTNIVAHHYLASLIGTSMFIQYVSPSELFSRIVPWHLILVFKRTIAATALFSLFSYASLLLKVGRIEWTVEQVFREILVYFIWFYYYQTKYNE